MLQHAEHSAFRAQLAQQLARQEVNPHEKHGASRAVAMVTVA
jgi:hypothetical protein